MPSDRRTSNPVATRARTPPSHRARRSLVVLAGNAEAGDARVRALADLLTELGVETIYLGREQSALRIAAMAAEEEADAIELCLDSRGGVRLLREVLRELIRVGRRDVSIVLHRLN